VARRRALRTEEQERIFRRLRRQSVDAMGLQSASELSDDERQVIVNLAVDRATERHGNRSRDLSWNGPLARWLAMTGRRPIREGVDIGDYNDRRRGRHLSWEDV
jgi:hypothetical protein